MQNSTLVIKNCDQTLKELIIDLEAAYKSRMKMGIRINFSGGSEIKYSVDSVENEKFFQLIKKTNYKVSLCQDMTTNAHPAER